MTSAITPDVSKNTQRQQKPDISKQYLTSTKNIRCQQKFPTSTTIRYIDMLARRPPYTCSLNFIILIIPLTFSTGVIPVQKCTYSPKGEKEKKRNLNT